MVSVPNPDQRLDIPQLESKMLCLSLMKPSKHMWTILQQGDTFLEEGAFNRMCDRYAGETESGDNKIARILCKMSPLLGDMKISCLSYEFFHIFSTIFMWHMRSSNGHHCVQFVNINLLWFSILIKWFQSFHLTIVYVHYRNITKRYASLSSFIWHHEIIYLESEFKEHMTISNKWSFGLFTTNLC